MYQRPGGDKGSYRNAEGIKKYKYLTHDDVDRAEYIGVGQNDPIEPEVNSKNQTFKYWDKENIQRKTGNGIDQNALAMHVQKNALGGTKEQLNFYVTNVSTVYAPTFFGFQKFYPKKGENDPLSHHILKNLATIKSPSNNTTYHRYKDIILMRGRCAPDGNQVFAFVDYNPDKYGPCFYLESREGFERATYTEPDVQNIPPEACVSTMSGVDGVDRFVRFLQNYMHSSRLKNKGQSQSYSQDSRTNTINPNTILSYNYRPNDKDYKSFYGYVPELNDGGPERHILELRFTSKSFTKKCYQFLISDEYLNLAAKNIVPTIRCFESSQELDLQWRFQFNIDFGQCYSTNNYTYLTHAQIKASINEPIPGAHYIVLGHDALTSLPPGTKDKQNRTIPSSLGGCIEAPFNSCNLVKIAFDIEANNSKDKLLDMVCFPVAKWTPTAFANRYKPLLTMAQMASISNCPTVETAREKLIYILSTSESSIQYCNKVFPSTFDSKISLSTRKERLGRLFIPTLEKTDPATVIAFITRQNEDGTQIKSALGAQIYTFRSPQSKEISSVTSIPRPKFTAGQIIKPQIREPTTTTTTPTGPISIPKLPPGYFDKVKLDVSNICSNPHFDNCIVREFPNEWDMLMAVITQWHQICPDFIVGHNITTFDLPYLIDRVEELCRTNATARAKFEQTPFTFSFIRGHQASYTNYSFDRNSAQKTTWTIKSPGVYFFDTWVGLKHSTFGIRTKSYKLGFLMSDCLEYPGTNTKMRKLEIDILTSSQLWHNRGDGLSYFLGYCLYDAVGSAMLSEKLRVIGSAMAISYTTGATPGSVFLRGVQNIILTMTYKTIWKNGKIYLFPDYDYREMHFMDLWYAHYDTNYKDFEFKDVRLLYETIPTLRRKWEMGGLRSIPDLRNDPKQYEKNPYLPKPNTEEFKVSCYSKQEIKQAQKNRKVEVKEGDVNPVTNREHTGESITVNVPPRIPKAKPYVGARVFQVMRGSHFDIFVPTWDKTSMYPTIAEANGLDFPNLVTEFTMRVFNIKRYTCERVVLGPKKLIQVGDVMVDRCAARDNGISDTDEIVYCYYYQNSLPGRSIFANMVRSLLSNRKGAKFQMARWEKMVGRFELCIKIMDEFLSSQGQPIDVFSKLADKLQTICDTPMGTENMDTPDKFDGLDYIKKAINVIKDHAQLYVEGGYNESVIKACMDTLLFEHTAGKNALVFGGVPPLILTPSHETTQYLQHLKTIIKSGHRRAKVEASIADVAQLGDKLVMNSGYGGVSMSDGLLPQIHLGSSITALGRKCISGAANIIENTDLLCEFEAMGPEVVQQVEQSCGKTFEQLRLEHAESRLKNHTEHKTMITKLYPELGNNIPSVPPYRNITMGVTNGDTDSTIAAIPRETLKVTPANLAILQKKGNPKTGVEPGLGISIAEKVNFFLPHKLIDGGAKPGSMNTGFTTYTRDLNRKVFDPRLRSHIVKGLMSNECEKIATVVSHIEKCKMYIQYVIMPTGKPEKNFKGVSPKKSDTLPYASKLIKDMCDKFMFKSLDASRNETARDRILTMLEYAHAQIIELLRGNYNPEDFRMNTRLQRPISAYEHPQDHVKVAIKKEKRGETVNIGDTMSYVYVMETKKGEDTSKQLFDVGKINSIIQKFGAVSKKQEENLEKRLEKGITHISDKALKESRNLEDAEYAFTHDIPLDIGYYLEKKIMPKLASFFSPLLFSPADYPEVPYNAPSDAKKVIKKLQKDLEKFQNNIAEQVLYKGPVQKWVDTLNTYRLQRQIIDDHMIHGKKVVSQRRIHRCIHCLDFYELRTDDLGVSVPEHASNLLALKPGTVAHSTMILHYIKESKDKAGFYGLCSPCQNSTTQQTLLETYKKESSDLQKKYAEYDATCWTCIDNTGVSMRASMVKAWQTKKDIPQKSLYYTCPADCTQKDCVTYKQKRAVEYMSKKMTNRVKVIDTLPSW